MSAIPILEVNCSNYHKVIAPAMQYLIYFCK